MSEQIRCLVWDLDNTLWNGTLVEGGSCRLRPGIRALLSELDRRGILLSIASTNDASQAIPLLARKRLLPLFLHPQIGWTNKIRSIRRIAEELGLALDTFGFIDDEPYERAQVEMRLPSVRTYPAASNGTLLDRPEFRPSVLSEESRSRRVKYEGSLLRANALEESGMGQEEFLAWSGTRMTLRRAGDGDVDRLLELMARTHQLNSTGVVYDAEQVRARLRDPGYRVFVAELEDRFVDYGRIGVAICDCGPDRWELGTFLLSCRVLSRGISRFFLSWVQHQAHREGVPELRGHYRKSGRNHRMRTLYQLAGFRPSGRSEDGIEIYARKPVARPVAPRWLTVREGS